MGCQLWPAGPPYGLVSRGGLAQKKIGRADDCPLKWPKPWTRRMQNFKPRLLGIQLNPSTLPGSSKPLEFVLTYFVPAPASVSSSIIDWDRGSSYDLHRSHFPLEATPNQEHESSMKVGVWHCGLDGATILSLNSIGTSGESQEYWPKSRSLWSQHLDT